MSAPNGNGKNVLGGVLVFLQVAQAAAFLWYGARWTERVEQQQDRLRADIARLERASESERAELKADVLQYKREADEDMGRLRNEVDAMRLRSDDRPRSTWKQPAIYGRP